MTIASTALEAFRTARAALEDRKRELEAEIKEIDAYLATSAIPAAKVQQAPLTSPPITIGKGLTRHLRSRLAYQPQTAKQLAQGFIGPTHGVHGHLDELVKRKEAVKFKYSDGSVKFARPSGRRSAGSSQ